MSNNNLVELFVGAPVDDPNEARVLSQLREDLARSGIRARIYANFQAGRAQRQIDFLISTESRLVQAELKCLNPVQPLIGGVNGPWQQVRSDGSVNVLNNFYDQARQATYAVGDEMTKLASKGEVPRHQVKYVKDIDSLVLIHPGVPKGSALAKDKHIGVIGYDTLVARLRTPGPRPAWTSEHWDAFVRHLGLYQPDADETPADRERRQVLDSVHDYQLRFASAHKADLHEYVAVHGTIATEQVTDLRPPVEQTLRHAGLVNLTGASGGGKSHLARHVAVTLADDGFIPILVHCRDFHGGQFPDLLRSAAARYTTERVVDFIDRSHSAGAPIVLVLDGLNECSATHRADLLSKLASFRLRHPAAVLITSTELTNLPDVDSPLVATIARPSRDERADLLRSYGSEPTDDLLAFDSPFDLALAAAEHRDLPAGSPRGHLYDAFIRRQATEDIRAALRLIATSMNNELRASLTVPEVHQLLRASRDIGPRVVDGILASPLLTVARNRISFVHELIARYLVAEDLVLATSDIDELLTNLGDPRHAELAEFVMSCDPAPERRWAVLRHTADLRLLCKGVQGAFGRRVAELVIADVKAVLMAAAWDTLGAQLSPGTGLHGVRWDLGGDRTHLDDVLLLVAWNRFRSAGEFADEITELLDASDEVCAAEVDRLRVEGNKAPINLVVAETSGGFVGRGLPVTALLSDQFIDLLSDDPLSLSPVTHVWTPDTPPRRWARIFAALRLIRSHRGRGLALAPELITAAWDGIGYHIRLEAMMTARSIARWADPSTSAGIVEALNRLPEPNDIWLSSSLVEALAAYGEIEPIMSLRDLVDEFRKILAEPEDPTNQGLAQHAFSAQYDPPQIVGPYFDALAELSAEELLGLAVTACSADREPVVAGPEIVRIIADAAATDSPEVIRAILRRYGLRLNIESGMVQESMAMHLEAVRGLANAGDDLRTPTDLQGRVQPAWGLVDAALYAIHQGKQVLHDAASKTRWRAMYGPIAGALACVERCQMEFEGQPFANWPYQLLKNNCGDGFREVFEQAIVHPDGIPAMSWYVPRRDVVAFAIRELATVGTAESIAILRPILAGDGEGGAQAAAAIRTIESRLDTTS